jgi:hypothetical protein
MRRLIATLTALLVLGAGTTAAATGGSSDGPTAGVAKGGVNRVGLYRGTTEVGGTVSFRITRKRKVVGFTMPDVPVKCVIQQPGQGEPEYDGPPITIKAPRMKLRGVAKFSFQDLGNDKVADSGFFADGKPDTTQGGVNPAQGRLKGNGGAFYWNGPAFEEGTEYCATEYVDWEAKKVGKKK